MTVGEVLCFHKQRDPSPGINLPTANILRSEQARLLHVHVGGAESDAEFYVYSTIEIKIDVAVGARLEALTLLRGQPAVETGV